MISPNISLPNDLKSVVDERVASGTYADASEYVGSLIRADQERRREETHGRFLTARLNSAGDSVEMDSGDWANLRRELVDHLAKRRS